MEKSLWMLVNAPSWIQHLTVRVLAPLIYLGRRSRVISSLKSAFPGYSRLRRESILFRSVPRTLFNIIGVLNLSKKQFEFYGLEPLELAHKRGQGAVVATMHVGVSDAGAYALAQRGLDVRTILGRGRHNPIVNKTGRRLLEQLGIPYHVRDSLVLLKSLRSCQRGEVVFIHSDLRDKSGIPVKMFNIPTQVPATAAYLSISTQVPLFWLYTRTRGDIIEVHVQQITEVVDDNKREKEARIEKLTLQIIGQIECIVTRYPEEWIWVYDRFK